MKSILIALLLFTPALAAWAYRVSGNGKINSAASASHTQSFSELIPIEILERGSAPRLIYLRATTVPLR